MCAYADVTFFNDWQKIAMDSADANLQMRELNVNEVRAAGLLHAYIKTRLTFLGPHWFDLATADDQLRRSNLVLMIDGRAVQPVERRVVKNHGTAVCLLFDFDVSPTDLLKPVMVISIDGDDGRRHKKKVDLAGILDIESN